MKKEEFISRDRELRDRITELESECAQLEKEYIESNFDKSLVGKKVRCYRFDCIKKEFVYVSEGYVAGINRLNWDDELMYQINKIKNDGTMSKASAGLYGITKVEPIEE